MLRPSCSTSGGQSFGGPGAAAALSVDMLWAVKEAKVLQARQLQRGAGQFNANIKVYDYCITYGFPSLPRITPLGCFFGGSAAAPAEAPSAADTLVDCVSVLSAAICMRLRTQDWQTQFYAHATVAVFTAEVLYRWCRKVNAPVANRQSSDCLEITEADGHVSYR